uniref:uncharacterized protein isoform X2 n=1 Tax=Pristiophorus japonicus TaxID=55135 RepID=UPI00398EC5A2
MNEGSSSESEKGQRWMMFQLIGCLIIVFTLAVLVLCYGLPRCICCDSMKKSCCFAYVKNSYYKFEYNYLRGKEEERLIVEEFRRRAVEMAKINSVTEIKGIPEYFVPAQRNGGIATDNLADNTESGALLQQVGAGAAMNSAQSQTTPVVIYDRRTNQVLLFTDQLESPQFTQTHV